MPVLSPQKFEYRPFPTEDDDENPRMLNAKIVKIDVISAEEVAKKFGSKGEGKDRDNFSAELQFLDPDLADRKAWINGSLVVSGPDAPRGPSNLSKLLLAVLPGEYELGDDYDTDNLKADVEGKFVRLQYGPVREKQGGGQKQDIIQLKPGRKTVAKAAPTKKTAPVSKAASKAKKTRSINI